MKRLHTYWLILLSVITLFPCVLVAQEAKTKDVVEIRIDDPKAEISIDGKSIGKGRTLYQPTLTFGKHTITATRPSYSVVTQKVTISADDIRSRFIFLKSPKPIYGYISVESNPTHAEIELDGQKTGKYTPYVFDSVLIGKHSVLLRQPGYYNKGNDYTVSELDTVHVNYTFTLKEEKKPTQYSSTSSSYNSGYSSSRSSYNSSSSTSASYSNNYSTSTYENKKEPDWRVMYFGLGGSVGTIFSAHLSFFNVRYKYIEFRPCVWGVSYSVLKDFPHHKLPKNTLVHKEWTSSSYHYEGDYEIAEPKRGAQWFYTPTLRVHIPLGDFDRAIVLGIGPQISWTKFKWQKGTARLDWLESYEFTNNPFPQDTYYFDGVWVTADVAYNMKFSDHTEFEIYLRYQDGFVFGMEVKFGKSY